jgi:glutaredoxin
VRRLDGLLAFLLESGHTEMMEVVLYTKPGCCLCDTVKAQLSRLRAVQPFEFREVNILEDSDAFVKYHEEIPVVFINGRKAFKYHLDEKAFLRRLQPRPSEGEKTAYGS